MQKGFGCGTTDGMSSAAAPQGFLYALIAYTAWGSFPLYWHQLHRIPHWEILSHRVVWSAFFLVLLSLCTGYRETLQRALSTRGVALRLMASGCLLAVNWGTYIYAVNNQHMVEASLGYFICPLFTIVLGLLFFRERLRPSQWMAIALAACGVCVQVVRLGHTPWLAFILAITFACYGAVKKGVAIQAVPGMCIETCAMLPCALLHIAWLSRQHTAYIPSQASSYETALLLCSGVVTSMPLIWFSKAATRLPLYLLGFTQFLSPTIQFGVAIFIYKETFNTTQALCFSFIWGSIAVLIWDGWYTQRMLRVKNQAVM